MAPSLSTTFWRSAALAQTPGTVIGVNGYRNGVDEFHGAGNTVIRDTNARHVLDFSHTELVGGATIDAARGNDIVTVSNVSDGAYRGGSGRDRFVVPVMPGAVDVVLRDFGKSGQDRIDLREFASIGLTRFDELDLSRDGDDTLLTLPGGDKTVRLVDLALAGLDARDFLFDLDSPVPS